MNKYQLEVTLLDPANEPVEGATITAEPEAAGDIATAAFDADRQTYYFNSLRPGFFRLTVRSAGFLDQSSRVQVQPKPTSLTFSLVPQDAAYTFRGESRVPYQSQPDRLGIIPAPGGAAPADNTDSVGQSLDNLLSSLGLVPMALGSPNEDAIGETPRRQSVPGAMIVQRQNQFDSMDSGAANNDLSVLRQSPLVEAAGPLFNQSEEGFTVFTNRLTVRFRPEVTKTEVEQLLNNENLSILDTLPYAANAFLTEAPPSIGEGINSIAQRLVNTGRVIYAEPNLAEAPELDQIIPNDFLWPGVWDRQLVGAPDAWQQLHNSHGVNSQFGSAEVIIAVVDQGIKSSGGVPENPDFQGTVSNNSDKTFRLFDFRQMAAHNDNPLGDHGVACAGVAAALANNPPGAAVGTGVAGAAPNARLIGLIFPSAEAAIHQMYIWAAGLDARSTNPNFPPQLPRGADIITCSIGFGSGSPLPGSARDMFDHITTRGRNGKGCLALFSAGNNNLNIENFRPYGSYERSFSCAASSLDPARREMRAGYSGWGKVAWCAPSNSGIPTSHNPPASFATWTASFLNDGNLPSAATAVTALIDIANPGDNRIRVSSVAGLSVGSHLLVGDPGVDGSEPVTVIGTPNSTTGFVPVSMLRNPHAVGDPVAAGDAHHKNDFGGTSSATPLSAGICALVLSAQPRLTWVEVREILRSTAVKFDTANTDPIGRWLDENGDPVTVSGLDPVFSRWYGFGRLDADAAVRAALAYDFPRDLMIRKTLEDTGETPSADSADSPDVWVRNTDPAQDQGALPNSYDDAGPHQPPVNTGGRWIYARVKNRGTQPSLDAWVRFYVASSSGLPFEHPADWEPRNGLSNQSAGNWERGTYLIGEVALPRIEGGEHIIVNLPWPDALMPPDVAPDGQPWNPHILVEVTPHDGPLEGALIHENNNLAEKGLAVTDELSLVGHEANSANS
ncbi:MAG TPA: S8 family serine peptidase [Pyrinomonadaceae bacterium]|nr:S8 family serine peptidase [Pyrinomonadaceae bacterium]